MSELTLYRKYRPGSFKELVGQDHIVAVLEAAIDKAKVAHAYLFAGSRGIGKTSVARILASALGVAASDLYEIDAASNRGIDEIRALREGVRTLPFESKYKIYIIDEVHMLTTPAFNALLKTLEEPPAHCIFVLATTDPERLPSTIVSRCEVHKFKRPSEADLRVLVTKVAKDEGYKLKKDAASLIALLSDGAFRDALGILQKVITVSGDKEITQDEVEKITGAPAGTMVEATLGSALDGDLEGALRELTRARDQGVDPKTLVRLLLRLLRFALLINFAPEMKTSIEADLSEGEIKFIEELTKRKEAKKARNLLEALLEAHEEVDHAVERMLPLELAFIKVLNS